MAEMKVAVDTSELDAALEKAERLSAMLDEIEGRFASLDGAGQVHPFPPRLSPDGSHWICDQCGREWGPGSFSGCGPCELAAQRPT